MKRSERFRVFTVSVAVYLGLIAAMEAPLLAGQAAPAGVVSAAEVRAAIKDVVPTGPATAAAAAASAAPAPRSRRSRGLLIGIVAGVAAAVTIAIVVARHHDPEPAAPIIPTGTIGVGSGPVFGSP